MNVFELFATLKLDSSEYERGLDEASNKSNSFLKGLGGMLGTTAKYTTVAMGATGAAVAGITSQAVDAYADYEQLAGGIETLFTDAEGNVEAVNQMMANAGDAWKTAGLSANEYMETAIESSAAMVSAVGGDTEEAARLMDMSITDMSDNVNKMGTSMESIQDAYRGFSRGNFTMLDNLALGYSGTKDGMLELMARAEEVDSTFRAVRDENGEVALSYDDIVKAIHIVQDDMGIAGTTAKEANETISGSLASLKSSWQNLITGFADPNADLGKLIDDFVQSGLTALNNLMPTIINALTGIAQALPQIVDAIAQQLPVVLPEILPPLIDAIVGIMNALVESLPVIMEALIAALPSIIQLIVDTVITLLPMIIDLGLQLILALADGLIAALPDLIPAIVDVILTIVDKLTQPDTIVQLVTAAIQLIGAIAIGIVKAIPTIIAKVPLIIMNIITTLTGLSPEVVKTGFEILKSFLSGIIDNIKQVYETGKNIFNSVKDGISEKIEGAKNWGKDLIDNFVQGIKDKFQKVKDTLSSLGDLIKGMIGFSEPEDPASPLHNFHTFAPDMMNLFAQGIESNKSMLQDTVADAFDFGSSIIKATPTPAYAMAGDGSYDNADMFDLFTKALSGVIIEVNIGDEKLDNIISTSIQRTNYRSGGR